MSLCCIPGNEKVANLLQLAAIFTRITSNKNTEDKSALKSNTTLHSMFEVSISYVKFDTKSVQLYKWVMHNHGLVCKAFKLDAINGCL